jgi:AcrR family transcriptional regulator
VKSRDGNAVRTERTRGRILDEALALFNERGEANVTTAAIAESLGMSPGNLYYHFRNKDAIVAELVRRFEERLALEPDVAIDAPGAIEDLWLYLHLVLEAIRDFHFLYRSLDDLAARDARLRARLNRIAERKYRGVISLCEGLVRVKAMRATPEEIRTVARNVLVVASYWLNFQSLRGGWAGRDADLGRGAHQVMSLVAPYLVGEARSHLDSIARIYIE